MFRVVKEDQESQIEGIDEVLIDENGQKIHNPTFLQMGWTGETVQDDKDPHKFRLRVIIPGEGFYQGLKATDGSDLPNSPIWLSIYHEFGHAYYRYIKPSSNTGLNALEFENAVRAINGMKQRAMTKIIILNSINNYKSATMPKYLFLIFFFFNALVFGQNKELVSIDISQDTVKGKNFAVYNI
jgi:hypothetical protein